MLSSSARIEAKQGGIDYGSSGVGAAAHLAGEMLKTANRFALHLRAKIAKFAKAIKDSGAKAE